MHGLAGNSPNARKAHLRFGVSPKCDTSVESELTKGHPPMPKTPAPKPSPAGRGDFLKITATVSPEVFRLVSNEVQRRKLAKEPGAQASAVLRECVLGWLGHGGGGTRK